MRLFGSIFNLVPYLPIGPKLQDKLFLSKAERRAIEWPDKLVLFLVWFVTYLAILLAASSWLGLAAVNWEIPRGVALTWGDVPLPLIAGGGYCAATAAIGLILIATFVGTARLGSRETLASVQAGLWKYAIYWLLIFLALATSLVIQATGFCSSGSCGGIDPRVVTSALLVPALLAASVGFVPVVIDTRKELRTARVKAEERPRENRPHDTTAEAESVQMSSSRPRDASLVAAVAFIIAAAAVFRAGRTRSR